MIPQGIPCEYRAQIWFKLTGAGDIDLQSLLLNEIQEDKFRHARIGYYEYLVSIPSTILDRIDLDIKRTFPEHPYFQSEEGRRSLRCP
jgi:hypothetical protein